MKYPPDYILEKIINEVPMLKEDIEIMERMGKDAETSKLILCSLYLKESMRAYRKFRKMHDSVIDGLSKADFKTYGIQRGWDIDY